MTPKVLHGPWHDHHRMALLYERAALELDEIRARTAPLVSRWERRQRRRRVALKATWTVLWASLCLSMLLGMMK